MRRRTPTLRAVVLLFGAAIFLSAGLVFLVQPMTAKMLLPTFGGSPQVWTAAMVFFQGALLAGYAWADLSVRRFGRRQPIVHVALLVLPAIVLPIGLRGLDAAGALPPAPAVVAILLVSVGAPYVAVSATSPLLQRWFSGTGHRAARDPYFLYAAGNVGSLLGLLGYPLLIEPRLPVAAQGVLWSAGYVVFALLCAACAVVLVRRGGEAVEDAADQPAERVTAGRRLGWLLRAFVPSSLMLGVTTYSSTDVAAVPLLWAIPLSLYLATFVLAFARRQVLDAGAWARILPFTTALVILTIVGVLPIPIWARLGIHYLGFFVAAMVAHTQLAEDRPSPGHLTLFYLVLALGGVLGGLFNAIVAPAAFDAVLEYPLVLVLALLLRPGPRGTRADRRSRLLDLVVPLAVYIGVLAVLVAVARLAPGTALAPLVVAAAAVATLVLVRRPVRHALATAGLLAITFLGGQPALLAERTFFGVNRVIDDGEGRHVYLSGRTTHGAERWDTPGKAVPLTYYHPSGPAGDVFARVPGGATVASTDAAAGDAHVVIIGLGAGNLAAYGRPGQHYSFVEIDPVVIEIARDPRLFSFVAESEARLDIHEADGRLWLAAAPDASADLIVVDAFSSDAIPAHLVTREALQLYAAKLRPGGRIAFNVSNAYLDVRSVVAGGGLAAGLHGLHRADTDLAAAPPGDKEVSEWVVLAPDRASLADLEADPHWADIATLERRVAWTDDFSDILGVIK